MLAKGAVEDADMLISTPKTKVMHVKKAPKKVKVSHMDFVEIEKKFKYVFEFCDKGYPTRQGLAVHKGR